jgi:hypothetical protein
MTKIQLAAKAGWNGLIVITAGQILSFFIKWTPEFKSIGWGDVLFFIVLCLLLAAGVGLLTNFKVPLRLTGVKSIIIEPDSFVYFAQIQRLVYIFAGLFIGIGFLEAAKKMTILCIRLLPSGREWISQWISGETSLAVETSFDALRDMFYPIAFLLFCVYLLLGADGLVRWQNGLLKRFTNKEQAHE